MENKIKKEEKIENTSYNQKNNDNAILENSAFKILGIVKKDEEITIQYFGKLLNTTLPSKLFICYGYGNMWEDRKQVEMKYVEQKSSSKDKDTKNEGKDDNKNNDKNDFKKYFEIKLKIDEEENLYFCFMDQNNKWDLNGTSSYCLEVIKNIDFMSKSENGEVVSQEETGSYIKQFFKKITDGFLSMLNKLGMIFSKSV